MPSLAGGACKSFNRLRTPPPPPGPRLMLLMMLLMLDRWIYRVKENIPKMAGINLNAGPSLGVDLTSEIRILPLVRSIER